MGSSFVRPISCHRASMWVKEFMEMKNTPAAIDAYRTAVNINQRDYRAWYGLGQTYELLNLHFYASAAEHALHLKHSYRH